MVNDFFVLTKMEEKIFTSLNLCKDDGHTEFICTKTGVLCRKCSQDEILKEGFIITGINGYISDDIDEAIKSWLGGTCTYEIFDFLKKGFVKVLFNKYFSERLDNDKYCQDCGDLFYHENRCQCYSGGFPG